MTTTSPRPTSGSHADGGRGQRTSPTRSGKRAGMTQFRQAAPGGLLLRTGLLPDLGSHPVEQLLHPRGTDRRGGRGPAHRGPPRSDPLGARLIRWRVSWVWYALAIGVPLFVHFASISINVALWAHLRRHSRC